MATSSQWREAADFDRLLQACGETDLLWLRREVLLHGRAPDDERCGCGCESRSARLVERRDHLDVVVNKITGDRVVLQHLTSAQDRAEFAVFCWYAHRVDIPLRCYDKQLKWIEAKPKVKAAFGGVRGGKSTVVADDGVDEALANGGPGVQLWLVAPTRSKTRICLRKLVEGQIVGKGRNRRFIRPILPPEIVVSYPRSEAINDQSILLVDGTRIFLHHANRKGDNLKGDPPIWIGFDEGCSVKHVENYQQFLDRLLEGDGRLAISTTPKAGHFLKAEVYDRGVELDKWDGTKTVAAWVTLTCFDNPWITEEFIEDTIRQKAGTQDLEVAKKLPIIRREIYGEWVADGPVLWTKWVPVVHLFHGASRDADDYGLRNITRRAAATFFSGHEGPLDKIAGQDFNVWPMCLVVAQIACHPAFDETDPQNWTLVILDEVIKRGNIFDFCDFLLTRAASYRRLPPDYFHGLAIACDPSGAQQNRHISRVHGMSQQSSTLAKEMKRRGFDCRPCNRSSRGKPVQPAILDRVSLGHKLMSDRIALPEGVFWQGRTEVPRLLVHEERCPELKLSIETQQSDDRGRPVKESGTASDRRSGPPDAMTYLSTAIFGSTEYRAATQLNW